MVAAVDSQASGYQRSAAWEWLAYSSSNPAQARKELNEEQTRSTKYLRHGEHPVALRTKLAGIGSLFYFARRAACETGLRHFRLALSAAEPDGR